SDDTSFVWHRYLYDALVALDRPRDLATLFERCTNIGWHAQLLISAMPDGDAAMLFHAGTELVHEFDKQAAYEGIKSRGRKLAALVTKYADCVSPYLMALPLQRLDWSVLTHWRLHSEEI